MQSFHEKKERKYIYLITVRLRIHYIDIRIFLFIQCALKFENIQTETVIHNLDVSSFALQTVRQSTTQSKLEINEKVSPQFESLPQMKE